MVAARMALDFWYWLIRHRGQNGARDGHDAGIEPVPVILEEERIRAQRFDFEATMDKAPHGGHMLMLLREGVKLLRRHHCGAWCRQHASPPFWASGLCARP